MSLPITARQLNALRALQQVSPDLGELATAVALAFDGSKIDHPHLAHLVLDKTCRRILAREERSQEALVQHLEHFAALRWISQSRLRSSPSVFRN